MSDALDYIKFILFFIIYNLKGVLGFWGFGVLGTAGAGRAQDRINTVNSDSDGYNAGTAEAGSGPQTEVEGPGEATRQRSQITEAVIAAGRLEAAARAGG